MGENIKKIKINEIFQDKYIIPIYQRKYAWKNTEIEQLLEDIITSERKYYLGTLVVDEKDNKYEVIDGQQRLITLYLLMLYLKEYENKPIEFEARSNYDKALCDLKATENCEITELYNAYKCIKDYLSEDKKTTIKKQLDGGNDDNDGNIFIVRVQVPKNIDLNNYFEIMNTRGEQLEQHHIAKARFISKMTDNKDKKIVATIWDACANMNSYLVKNFSKDIREQLFLNDFSSLNEDLEKIPENMGDTWGKLAEKFNNENSKSGTTDYKTSKLLDIINKAEPKEESKNNEDSENYSFASIINFPYFLLHVNAVLSRKEENDEDIQNLYDDKKLVKNLEKYLASEISVKKFIYCMLWYRFLFDMYIIKRDIQDDDDNLELVLKRYTKQEQEPVNTFKNDDDDKYTQNRLIMLQSMLRITYTSPRNMQWITELLKDLINQSKDSINLKFITDLLEEYCIGKIKDSDIKSLDTKKYGDIERIVFTYLDYLLYRDGYINKDDKEIIRAREAWKFHFRTSVEHFYPQNPEHPENEPPKHLDSFGNLALITVSGNSQLSNLLPKEKKDLDDMKRIIEQSLKFKIMASYEEWNDTTIKEHQEEMIKILEEEIKNKNLKN